MVGAGDEAPQSSALVQPRASGPPTRAITSLPLALGAFLLLAIFGPLAALGQELVKAARADDFRAMLGVNIHVVYWDTSYGKFSRSLAADLAYLGIKHVRDGSSDKETFDTYRKLIADGIRFDWIINPSSFNPLPRQLKLIGALAAGTDSLEGPNETDIDRKFRYAGQVFPAGTVSLLRDIRAGIRGSLASLPLANASLANWANIASLGDQSSIVDLANAHVYRPRGLPIATVAHEAMRNAQANASGKPVIWTEMGYSTAVDEPEDSGVDEITQAKQLLSGLFDAWVLRVGRVYIYELLDERTELARLDREAHFGLFRVDNTPKPAATALHKLANELHSKPGIPELGSLAYSLTGLPTSAQHTLLQRSDGSMLIVLWNEPRIWDGLAHKPIAVPAVSAILHIGGAGARSLRHYDPLSDTATDLTITDPHSIPVKAEDHPVLLEVIQNECAG